MAQHPRNFARMMGNKHLGIANEAEAAAGSDPLASWARAT
jgi:hypothetical protein